MRFLKGILFALVILAPSATANEPVELLNSTLIAKLHLDHSPNKAQMVAAYQVRFRNTGDIPLSSVNILLNPGLTLVRAVGKNNAPLRTNEATGKAVAGMDMLQLNAAAIALSSPLKPGKDREIVLHYRGFLQALDWTGLKGVKETLAPDYALLRAEGFAYPVFAGADIASIRGAWDHKPFYQVATVEYPGAATAVSNLSVDSRALSGSKTQAELSSGTPTSLMVVALGSYGTTEAGAVSVNYLNGKRSEAETVAALFNAEVQTLQTKLGTISGANLKIIELADGYVTGTKSNSILVDAAFMADPMVSATHRHQLVSLWRFNTLAREGHWGTGLDKLTEVAITAPTMLPEVQTLAFASAELAVSDNSQIGKTPLADFVIEGFSSAADSFNVLAFGVLYDLLGEDEFFTLVRSVRDELGSGYADMQALAEHMDATLKNKDARKFIKNWFLKGRAGKDLQKAGTFQGLVALYK